MEEMATLIIFRLEHHGQGWKKIGSNAITMDFLSIWIYRQNQVDLLEMKMSIYRFESNKGCASVKCS